MGYFTMKIDSQLSPQAKSIPHVFCCPDLMPLYAATACAGVGMRCKPLADNVSKIVGSSDGRRSQAMTKLT